MQDIRKEDHEFDKVVDLFTPKYPRKNSFSFSRTCRPQKQLKNRTWWAIGSIAAMFVIVITIAIKSVVPVSAREVVSIALDKLCTAKSVKVEFAWRGLKTAEDEIYTPDISGDTICGTLYLLQKDNKVYTRIDWHDAEKNSIIFNGSDYIRLKNGITIDKHRSSFGNELMDIVNFNSLQHRISDFDITGAGNVITVKSHKDIITFCGEFCRDSNMLVKASVTAVAPDGKDINLLETKSIVINADVPDTIFSGQHSE